MRVLRLLSAGLIAAAVAGCATSGYRDGYSRDYYGDRYYDQGYYGPSAGVSYRRGHPYGNSYGAYYGYGSPYGYGSSYGYGSPYGYGGSPYGYGYSPYGNGGYYGSPYGGYGYGYPPRVVIVQPGTNPPPQPRFDLRDEIGRQLRISRGLEAPPPGGAMRIPVPEQARVQQREAFPSRSIERASRQESMRGRVRESDMEIETP
ncbi:MAG TPA: hypothetical protein VNI56_02115 [Xanthomonadaceae bacterium]|nr:hypothetical protein [Xanthomonadaceae bacterium]